MSKVKIGISSAFVYDANYSFPGYPRLMLNEDYSRSVQAAGGVPVVLPITADYEVAKVQVAMVDALLLSGGQDVNPQEFGQEPMTLVGENSVERDIYEKLLLKAALELDKPVMGICRGMQIMNVYFGGTLFQDNSLKEGAFIKHDQRVNPAQATHKANIAEDSVLFKATGKTVFNINSFHHQSVDQVADGFKATAVAEDGIIEAMEAIDGKRMFAVQWHPEMLSRENREAQEIFRYFIQYVRD